MPKLLFCLLSALLFSESASARLKAVSLTCEDLNEPMAVGTLQPRFSWLNVTEENERNQRQTAFQIQVASTMEKLLLGEADLWDSGRRKSDATRYVTYQGLPLTGNADCYWRVRVWDKHRKCSDWSEPTRFHTALHSSDWVAKWIGFDEEAPLFQKEFVIDKPVQNAHIFSDSHFLTS